jgi:hypothetical protein
MLVERGGAPPRALRLYGLSLAGVAVLAIIARILVQAACPGACRALVPFEEVAQRLRSAGFAGNGTIVVSDFHIGGNLRVQFPAARIVDIGYPPRVWPAPRGQGQCLVLWPLKAKVESALDGYLLRQLAVAASAPRGEGSISVPMPGSHTRAYRLNYRLYEGSQGDCR